MSTPRPHPGTHLHTAARQAASRLRRLAAAACALLATAAIVPAASASIPIPNGGPTAPAAVRVVTVGGGMAGWQIALIAAGAALVAAIAAVALDRARAARKTASAMTRPVWP